MKPSLSKETVDKLVLNSNALYPGSVVAEGYNHKQKDYQSLVVD